MYPNSPTYSDHVDSLHQEQEKPICWFCNETNELIEVGDEGVCKYCLTQGDCDEDIIRLFNPYKSRLKMDLKNLIPQVK